MLTQLNTFLATAIGGLVFTLLTALIKSIYRWLTQVKEKNKFLVDELKIPPIKINITLSEYRKNTLESSLKDKIMIYIGAAITLLIGIIMLFSSIYLFRQDDTYQIKLTNKRTEDAFLIKSGSALSATSKDRWIITLNTCNTPDELQSITEISKEAKKYICRALSIEDKSGSLPFYITKYIWENIILATILLLASAWIITVGIGLFFHMEIIKKISDKHKKEIEKSYDYIT
ncbi:hypothetical protein FEM41_02140 [Jejubacter calystegiae]|uniref:Uncharacterized protein n=1 Tax=Jejubacter calystegiae TaxID=2579935 RepID=A0A4P8YD91_9ENTR|nr:DUF6216 family protein [Jejubacter calystegiae]QCT18525.1 hypothetical protein FEM41_02140 [Jejubacter calystegiae]